MSITNKTGEKRLELSAYNIGGIVIQLHYTTFTTIEFILECGNFYLIYLILPRILHANSLWLYFKLVI